MWGRKFCLILRARWEQGGGGGGIISFAFAGKEREKCARCPERTEKGRGLSLKKREGKQRPANIPLRERGPRRGIFPMKTRRGRERRADLSTRRERCQIQEKKGGISN